MAKVVHAFQNDTEELWLEIFIEHPNKKVFQNRPCHESFSCLIPQTPQIGSLDSNDHPFCTPQTAGCLDPTDCPPCRALLRTWTRSSPNAMATCASAATVPGTTHLPNARWCGKTASQTCGQTSQTCFVGWFL